VSRRSRRRFLAAAGASLAALAGCAARTPFDGSDDGTATGATETAGAADDSAGGMDGTPAAPDVVDRKVETFVDRLDAGAFDWAAGMFGSALAGTDPERLAVTWRGLTIQHGPFEGYEVVGREVRDDRSLRAVDLGFAADAQRLSLVFDPYARIVGIDFPTREAPPPATPGRSVPVTLDAGDCSVGGTVTLPAGDGPVPGVVIVHRSGPLDRDGAVGPNRPYRDVAAGLAARGVAALRYDKRSFVCDLPKEQQSFADVVVADAAAAVRRLAAVDRVSRVAVFGHGLGGVAAPLVAREAAVAGVVLAATPTRPLPAVFLGIERQKATADGRITDAERERLDFFAEKLGQVSELGPEDDYYLLGTATRFWRDLRETDVVAAVRDRPEPALALHPGRGFVTTGADRDRWRETLPAGAVRDYPRLDHLFMHVFDDSLPEAYFFPDTVDAAVLDDVAAWVRSLDADG
jgi:hypothetical protein